MTENTKQQPDRCVDVELESLIWRTLILCVRSNLGMKETTKRIAEAITATPKRESGWQPMNTAPKDGRRVALLCDGETYHGWYEENFGCFMGMDEDWNLWKLGPSVWQPLSKIEGDKS